MTSTPILLVHIAAGGVGLMSGAAALALRKGGHLHQTAGKIFGGAMLIMASTAAYLGVTGPFGIGAALGAALTFYLAATGWATVARKQRGVGLIEIACLLLGLSVAGAYTLLILHTPMKGAVYFLFVGLGLAAFGAGLDLIVILRGGISGTGRVMRHVWRMCVPLFQATSFFFLAQPALFHGVPMLARAAPPLAVMMLMMFWLARVPFIQRFKARDFAPA